LPASRELRALRWAEWRSRRNAVRWYVTSPIGIGSLLVIAVYASIAFLLLAGDERPPPVPVDANSVPWAAGIVGTIVLYGSLMGLGTLSVSHPFVENVLPMPIARPAYLRKCLRSLLFTFSVGSVVSTLLLGSMLASNLDRPLAATLAGAWAGAILPAMAGAIGVTALVLYLRVFRPTWAIPIRVGGGLFLAVALFLAIPTAIRQPEASPGLAFLLALGSPSAHLALGFPLDATDALVLSASAVLLLAASWAVAAFPHEVYQDSGLASPQVSSLPRETAPSSAPANRLANAVRPPYLDLGSAGSRSLSSLYLTLSLRGVGLATALMAHGLAALILFGFGGFRGLVAFGGFLLATGLLSSFLLMPAIFLPLTTSSAQHELLPIRPLDRGRAWLTATIGPALPWVAAVSIVAALAGVPPLRLFELPAFMLAALLLMSASMFQMSQTGSLGGAMGAFVGTFMFIFFVPGRILFWTSLSVDPLAITIAWMAIGICGIAGTLWFLTGVATAGHVPSGRWLATLQRLAR